MGGLRQSFSVYVMYGCLWAREREELDQFVFQPVRPTRYTAEIKRLAKRREVSRSKAWRGKTYRASSTSSSVRTGGNVFTIRETAQLKKEFIFQASICVSRSRDCVGDPRNTQAAVKGPPEPKLWSDSSGSSMGQSCFRIRNVQVGLSRWHRREN